MKKSYRLLALLLLLLVQACQSTKYIKDSTSNETFRKVSRNPERIISHIPDYAKSLKAVSGKARVVVSQPGVVQRGTIYFNSNRQQSLFTFRNSLGIEGGQLYFNRDSALVYNRIDKYARKMSLQSYSYIYLNGIEPINPMDLLAPKLANKKVKEVFESPASYAILYKDGTKVIVGKRNYQIKKISYPQAFATNYSTLIFDGYAAINGYVLPRKIQILSSDKKSDIFLLIQSLKVNPQNLNFDIKLPAHLKIQHL